MRSAGSGRTGSRRGRTFQVQEVGSPEVRRVSPLQVGLPGSGPQGLPFGRHVMRSLRNPLFRAGIFSPLTQPQSGIERATLPAWEATREPPAQNLCAAV
jgi:hypothetical protein